MAQNIIKKEDKKKNQPTRDVEEMIEKSKNKDLNDNEPEETEEEFLKYIKEDAGL